MASKWSVRIFDKYLSRPLVKESLVIWLPLVIVTLLFFTTISDSLKDALGAEVLSRYIFLQATLRLILIVTAFRYLLRIKVVDGFFSKCSQWLNKISSIQFFSLIFFLILAFKLLFIQLDFTPSMLSYKELLEAALIDKKLFVEFDDSPLYTVFLTALMLIFNRFNFEFCIFVNILLGCFTVIMILKTFELFFPSRIFLFITGLLMGLYAPAVIWELALRYDVFVWFTQAALVWALFFSLCKPSAKSYFTLALVALFASAAKETVIYIAPLYIAATVAFLFVGLKKKQAGIIILCLVIPLFGAKVIKDQIYVEKFGISSIKKDDVLFVNGMLYSILKSDMQTNYPELRDRAFKYYSGVFNEQEREQNVFWKESNLSRIHEMTNPVLYHRDELGHYDHGLSPFLNEILPGHPWVYAKNSFIKFIIYTSKSVYRWEGVDNIASRVGGFVSSTQPFETVNTLLTCFIYSYFYFSFLLVLILLFLKKFGKQMIFAIFCSLFPIYYGMFMAAATYAEYHRLMIPAFLYFIPGISLFIWLIITSNRKKLTATVVTN